MNSPTLHANYSYLSIAVDDTDGNLERGGEHQFRRSIQDSLTQLFGLSGAGVYLDVLRFRKRSLGKDEGPDNFPNLKPESTTPIIEVVVRVSCE